MMPETSQFESSETLAAFLASTPLLEDSWRMCTYAALAQQGFAAEQAAGTAAIVAFSAPDICGDLVEIGAEGGEIFGPLCNCGGGDREEAAMVHGGLLRCFLAFHGRHCFQQKLHEVLNNSKSLVFTGHGFGGAVASLAALWLLSHSHLQKASRSLPVFCITFGSPMLGNESFSRAVLQQRWGGNFCHVVAHQDIIPRMFFASPRLIPQIFAMFQLRQFLMASSNSNYSLQTTPCTQNQQLLDEILAGVEARSKHGEDRDKGIAYWPFGSYVFCNEKGAVCLDNARAVVKFLHSMLARSLDSIDSCLDDHLRYECYVRTICRQYLCKERFVKAGNIPESSSEAGIALTLQSSGISPEEPVYEEAMNYLLQARQLGWRRNLNSAKMAVCLSRITPFRAELECYKAFCDNSNDRLGYYDSFRRKGASKRDFKVNMNMRKLAHFWDDLIDKIQTNQLTPDFHKQPKYVNASHFYKLLVEPLEIAKYYREGMHTKKGHYIENGRDKRFKVFDKWWSERKVGEEESKQRSKYASLTQDSCFWARVEESLDLIVQVKEEMDPGTRILLLDKIERFDAYARGMVDRMEVSVDVLAEKSSYSLFREKWKELKSWQQVLWRDFPGYDDGMAE